MKTYCLDDARCARILVLSNAFEWSLPGMQGWWRFVGSWQSWCQWFCSSSRLSALWNDSFPEKHCCLVWLKLSDTLWYLLCDIQAGNIFKNKGCLFHFFTVLEIWVLWKQLLLFARYNDSVWSLKHTWSVMEGFIVKIRSFTSTICPSLTVSRSDKAEEVFFFFGRGFEPTNTSLKAMWNITDLEKWCLLYHSHPPPLLTWLKSDLLLCTLMCSQGFLEGSHTADVLL